MTKEIEDTTTRLVESKTKFFECAYNDGMDTDPKQFEDDCFIHVARGKYRFVFYNGQEEGRFTESSVNRFAKLVDSVLKKGKKLMKKHITFYFSFSEIVEGKNQAEIVKKAESMAMKELGENCFDYFDEKTIEKIK